MEIVVRGRRTDVADRFRAHVEEKMAKLGKYDGRLSRVDVEVTHENNPRLAGEAERVEITAHSKGPVIRAEAAAQDRYAALDAAVTRIEARLRRAAERRRDKRGRAPGPHEAMSGLTPLDLGPAQAAPAPEEALPEDDATPLVVREKTHRADPMSLDQALYEMELVGHDFFLFVDDETKQPSVVYRRRGYQYGVIRLDV